MSNRRIQYNLESAAGILQRLSRWQRAMNNVDGAVILEHARGWLMEQLYHESIQRLSRR